MRRLLTVLALLAVTAMLALADQCLPAPKDALQQSIDAIQSGRVSGQFITGQHAADMAEDVGLLYEGVEAAFLIEHGDDLILVFAVKQDGAYQACWGFPDKKAVERFRSLRGHSVRNEKNAAA